jgi:hypothetical protein
LWCLRKILLSSPIWDKVGMWNLLKKSQIRYSTASSVLTSGTVTRVYNRQRPHGQTVPTPTLYGSIVLSLDRGRFFTFLSLYTVGRTAWTSDQTVARPLPIHRTTQHRINAHRHALSEIRTHDPSVRTSEDNSCAATVIGIASFR